MKKVIIARVRIKPGKEAALTAAATTLVAATRQEPGCLSYDFLRDPADPLEFRFVEQWQGQASIDAHFRAPHFTAFGSVLAQVSETRPQITIYDIAAERVV